MNAQELETATKNYVTSHKGTVAVVIVALLLILAAFLIGRYTVHAEVKTTEKVVTHETTKIQYQDRVVTKIQYVNVAKKDKHTDTTIEKRPDGTVITHVVDDTHTAKQENSTTDKDALKQETVVKTVYQTITKEKLVLNQPSWAVSVGAGVDIPYFLGQGQHGVPGMQGFVIQAGIDRRIVGPLWAGLFGNTEGVAGLNLKGAW